MAFRTVAILYMLIVCCFAERNISTKFNGIGGGIRIWRVVAHSEELKSCSFCPSNSILEILDELGFIDVRSRELIAPKMSLWYEHRIRPFLQYIDDYLLFHPNFSTVSYFTLYDGWREHTAPASDPAYALLQTAYLKRSHVGRGSANEPGRFISQFETSNLFPVLNLPVLAFNRHRNDPCVMLIPDTEFISTSGFADLMREIEQSDIPWHEKKNILIWRGNNNGIGYEMYNIRDAGNPEKSKLLNQRELLVRLAANNSRVTAHFVKDQQVAPKKMLLQYKYQIDVDGEVNAWSGLWWKLYSKSVVFKVASHYEQWYYNHLVPWIHYIPVHANLSNLDDQLLWALHNDMTCREIARQGNLLVTRLTYSYAIQNYTIEDHYAGFLKTFNMNGIVL